MSRARDIASGADFSTGIDAGEVVPHIIPNTLYPAYRGLLSGNTTGRTFVDSGGTGHTIGASASSRVSHTTGLKKIGNSSLRFDGYDGDFLTIADHADFDRSTGGDFTWEFWINIDGLQTNYTTVIGSLDSDIRITIGPDASTAPKMSVYGPWGSHLTTTTTLSLNTWHHFAYVRDSGTIRLYVNGVQEATLSNTSDIDPDLIRIGQYYNTTLFFKGNLDEIRFSDNARYTSGTTFTPSTTAFSSDGNTKLLIHSNESLVHSGAYGTAQSDGRSYYYTDIQGSKPIKDPRIGGHFGSQRHKVRSLQKLEQETATHGDDVYSIDGREWMKYIGGDGTDTFNDSAGQGVHMTNAGDTLEITGYFSDMNFSMYSGGSYDAYTLYIDGGVGTSKTNPATTASPLAGRYVDPSSVVNVGLGATLGIHTVKIIRAGDSLYFYNIELIAQDTSSTANRSKIQIPSQNVVSYGKKFTVSGTPHYNPFDGMSGAKTLAQLGDYIDTATSLGMDNWKAGTANYYKPFNGGRVVKWVDSSGTIKTSVTMMPPNAQNIGTTASNAFSDGEVQAGTNDHTITFNTTAIENSLSEVAKTFHIREFGNGAANQGNNTSGTLQDFSMANAVDDWAYVMDDGLTSASSTHHRYSDFTEALHRNSSSGKFYHTFIGTGISRRSGTAHTGAGYHTLAQNLPYGTHILAHILDGSNTSDWFLDGVQIYDNSGGSAVWLNVGESLHIHQPKKPPIPEDAVVLADYMLMADFVPATSVDGAISKGTRYCDGSRDVFYDSGASLTHSWANHALGYQVNSTYNHNAASEGRIVGFGHAFGCHYVRGTNREANIQARLDGANYTYVEADLYDTSGEWDDTNDDGTITKDGGAEALHMYGIKNQTLGNHTFGDKLTSGGGDYNAWSGFEIATPIHTSSHYQTFETPFLHELVGGDRNMEQTNLVVTPDGKTWDQLRDTRYLGPSTQLNCTMDNGHVSSTNPIIWDEWRGINSSRPCFNKNIAIAYDRTIILEDGIYQIELDYYNTQNDTVVYVTKNTTTASAVNGIHQRNDLVDNSNSAQIIWEMKRGDWIYVQVTGGGSNAFHGNDSGMQQYTITKLN